jgi:hypothetical protein
MNRVRGMFLVLGLAAWSACGDRLHLTDSYARSFRQTFGRQVANPAAQSRAPRGLDAQEAAAVVAAYRSQLAPRATRYEDQQPMLLIAPQPAPGNLPPPSVQPGR